MRKENLCALVLFTIFSFSCVSGNVVGVWESEQDEDGRFKRYSFSEFNEFTVENCRTRGATGTVEADKVYIRCFEVMKGEYQVKKICDSTIDCLISPEHKIILTPKSGGGIAGAFARLAGPQELDFTRKSQTLKLGEDILKKVK